MDHFANLSNERNAGHRHVAVRRSISGFRSSLFRSRVSQLVAWYHRSKLTVSMLLLGCLLACQQNLHAQFDGHVQAPMVSSPFPAIPVAYRTSGSDLPTSEVAAEFAAHRSAAARLLRKQASASQSSSGRHDEIEAYYVYRCFVLLQADHQSQRSASQALEAYYGYAALQAASQIQRELIVEIDDLRLTLANLIDKGITVGDTTQQERARIQAADALIQSEYGMQRIHSQLSLLVGSEVGCQLQVDHLQPPSIPYDSVCDLIEQAYCNRRDFAAWDFLSRKLNIDNLPGLRDVVGSTALIPAFPSSLSNRWVDKLVPGRLAKLESELCERQKQLAEIKQSLRKQIAVDVEVAWLDHSAAYQRWELAGQNVASWKERIEQLDRAAELGKAFPEDRITAKLEVKRAELERIQRWNDVQQAHVRLRQAIGDLPTR
jgi:hypothetical protein